jgi:hypothetical protein
VFDTELMGIEGVKEEEPEEGLVVVPTASDALGAISTALPHNDDAPASPMEKEDDGECHLLGPFAIFVQAALGLLAILSLVWKRYRETPRRPVKIWAFDASKQVVGSALLHLANLFMSMLSSGSFDVKSTVPPSGATFKGDSEHEQTSPNPCSFYLLNLAIDVS